VFRETATPAHLDDLLAMFEIDGQVESRMSLTVIGVEPPSSLRPQFEPSLDPCRLHVQFRWLGDRPSGTPDPGSGWRFEELRLLDARPWMPRIRLAALAWNPKQRRSGTRIVKLRLVVLGMMGRSPFGGQSWLYLNWLRGLLRLGHEVWYVEDDTVWPYDPVKNTVTDDCSYAVRHIAQCTQRIGMQDRWAFRLADRPGACWGLTEPELRELYRSCDALLNIVGATGLRDEQLEAAFRVYVETDPATAELRLAAGGWNPFSSHHVIATYGENYGEPDCGVPLNGITYQKTRQPVDLDLWPRAFDPDAPFFTTIGNYRQSGNDVEYAGEVYRWSKHHEWEKFVDLPRLTTQRFRLGVMPDDPADRRFLEEHGWQLEPPFEMSLDVFGAYPEFIRRSRGEFTVAKDQNVRLRSGWFSERDVCYLASGKPVVTQDTGFSKYLPVGEGLFGVRTVEEAAAAIDEINRDYERHCRAARRLAEEHFEARAVAARLLDAVGLTNDGERG
jgi:hypothetical protein